MWLAREEEAFGRTLEQGTRLLYEHHRARQGRGLEGIGAEEAFQLHDTFGFPFELTAELAAEQDMGVDAAGLRARDGGAARRARGPRAAASWRATAAARRSRRSPSAPASRPSSRATRRPSRRRRSARSPSRTGACWSSSSSRPFYATGGGQVADVGEIAVRGRRLHGARVDVIRLGDDQALVLEPVRRRAARGRAGRRERRPRPPAARPRPTTPRRTCCTPRCASASAATSARPAPTSAPTSCASTSPTARR